MQEITPFLWFNGQAEQAANFYVSLFPNSRITAVSGYTENSPGEPGTIMVAAFELAGQSFSAINGGPLYKVSPAISFFVNCESEQEINTLWEKLSEGGMAFMPLDKYPFSDKFGWMQDKFGVSWQLNLAPRTQKITPFFTFVGEQAGKAREAMEQYTSLFPNSEIKSVATFPAGMHEPEGNVMHAIFTLNGQEFMAMESTLDHKFTFTPGLSLLVNCENQAEVDKYWDALSEGGHKDQCGWLSDKYGVSWQIVPVQLGQLMSSPDRKKANNVMQAMLKMRKLDIAKLEEAAVL